MLFSRGAPAEIVQKLAPTNSGTGKGLASKQEIDAIWLAFERAYGSRERALAASRKNSQVLLPFINSPATISGANAALVELFGNKGALEIIKKNPGASLPVKVGPLTAGSPAGSGALRHRLPSFLPGVLACNPATLITTSKNDIVNAANLVDSIENLPPNIKSGIPFLTTLAIFGSVGSRLITCGQAGATCGADWDLQGGLGPQAVNWISSLFQ